MSPEDSFKNKIKFPECFDNKIRIVEFSKKHLTQQYVDWLNDPEVVYYSEQRHHKHTLASCLDYFESQRRSQNYFLAIEVINSNDRHVGNIGVAVDPFNSLADVSIIIGEKSVWGTGIASRAWGLVLDVLIKKLDFKLVTAGTMETNIPMIRLMKRSGMTIDAILPNRFVGENKRIGLVAASYSPLEFLGKIDG